MKTKYETPFIKVTLVDEDIITFSEVYTDPFEGEVTVKEDD